MQSTEPRSQYVTFRCTPSQLAKLERLGADTEQSRSNLVWFIVTASLSGNMTARELWPDKFND